LSGRGYVVLYRLFFFLSFFFSRAEWMIRLMLGMTRLFKEEKTERGEERGRGEKTERGRLALGSGVEVKVVAMALYLDQRG
jgi:hypothetical protein